MLQCNKLGKRQNVCFIDPEIFTNTIFQAVDALNHLLPFLDCRFFSESRHGVINQVFVRTFVRCLACSDLAFNAIDPFVKGHPKIRMEVELFK